MVFGWYIKQIVKKKYSATSKDKSDWLTFVKNIGNLASKDEDDVNNDIKISKVRKLDLHGYSIISANHKVKEFIIESFDRGYKKIIIITGKGLRSKVYEDPYRSEKMNVLRNSIPEYIKNDEELFKKINKITTANLKDGGDGALYIFLKNKKIKE